jgi:hypothetical protein
MLALQQTVADSVGTSSALTLTSLARLEIFDTAAVSEDTDRRLNLLTALVDIAGVSEDVSGRVLILGKTSDVVGVSDYVLTGRVLAPEIITASRMTRTVYSETRGYSATGPETISAAIADTPVRSAVAGTQITGAS